MLLALETTPSLTDCCGANKKLPRRRKKFSTNNIGGSWHSILGIYKKTKSIHSMIFGSRIFWCVRRARKLGQSEESKDNPGWRKCFCSKPWAYPIFMIYFPLVNNSRPIAKSKGPYWDISHKEGNHDDLKCIWEWLATQTLLSSGLSSFSFGLPSFSVICTYTKILPQRS